MRWSKSLKAAGMKDWACKQFKKISSKYKDYGKLNKQSYSQLMFYLVLNILSCCVKQTCGGAEIIAFPLKLLNRCFDKGHFNGVTGAQINSRLKYFLSFTESTLM